MEGHEKERERIKDKRKKKRRRDQPRAGRLPRRNIDDLSFF